MTLTKEIQVAICTTIEAGNYREVAAQAAGVPLRYRRRRDELWFTVPELARDNQVDFSRILDLPDGEEILEEMRRQAMSATYTIDGAGRRIVMEKDEWKKQGLGSPDELDAINLSFCEPADSSNDAYGEILTSRARPLASRYVLSRWRNRQLQFFVNLRRKLVEHLLLSDELFLQLGDFFFVIAPFLWKPPFQPPYCSTEITRPENLLNHLCFCECFSLLYTAPKCAETTIRIPLPFSHPGAKSASADAGCSCCDLGAIAFFDRSADIHHDRVSQL